MDQAERTKYKQLANDAIIDLFGQDTRELRLAEGLERALEELNGYDEALDKVGALEEVNDELEDTVKDLRNDIRDIYRTTKSANSSDVKRLAEIQETCEDSGVDLGKSYE